MRVLLIVPTFRYGQEYPAFMSNSDFPAGFAYLASALEGAGHEVFGVNPNNDPGFESAQQMVEVMISRAIADHRPQLIGVGGLCTDFHFIRDVLSIIRRCDPGVPTVCGGGIVTNDAAFIFPLLHPDFCILGEADRAIVELAGKLEGGRSDFDTIPNLGYWRDGEPCFSREDYEYGDIDELSFPDYAPFGIDGMLDKFSLAARYLYRYTRPDARPMTLVAARSCPFSCSFCVHKTQRKYRARSIDNIMAEIELLYDRYRFNLLIILDELFAANKTRLAEFCQRMLEGRREHGWDFDWIFQTHANARLDLESLQMAKAAGCNYFSYGIESASPTVLKSMNKRIKPEQIRGAIALAEEVGIGFGGNFIFGDTAETSDTIGETLRFLTAYCLDCHLYVGDVRPYPGSRLFEQCLESGIIRDKAEYYETIDRTVYNMTSMPDGEWASWMNTVISLSRFPFVKTAAIDQLVREDADPGNPMTGGARRVWRVSGTCPHCGERFSYREVVDEGALLSSGLAMITGCMHCHKRVRVNIPVNRRTAEVVIQPVAGRADADEGPRRRQASMGVAGTPSGASVERLVESITTLVEKGEIDRALALYDRERPLLETEAPDIERFDQLMRDLRSRHTPAAASRQREAEVRGFAPGS